MLGAAGGIGQPLSLLMSVSPYVHDLALYDLYNTPGVATDLSHINSACNVEGYTGQKSLKQVLSGADAVIIAAGLPRKPGMARDDLLLVNAGIAMELAKACATYCPQACALVITNPVNSTVPIFSEVYKKMGVHDPRKIMGVTILDTLRASTFIGRELRTKEKIEDVPIVGGHAGKTIIPLFSQLPNNQMTQIDIPAITHRVQFGGDEVVVAKAGMGSATLSMAYAGAIFAESVLKGLKGEEGIIEPAYVEHEVYGCPFFASQVELGKEGVERPIPIPKNLTKTEEANIQEAIPALQKQIAKGIQFTDENFK